MSKEVITVEPGQSQAIAVREIDDLIPIQASERAIQRIQAFKYFAQSQMKFGEHYDVLPQEQWKVRNQDGSPKKSTEEVLADPSIKKFMNQAGADLFLSAFGLGIETEILEKITDWDKPFFSYKVRVWLVHPQTGTKITSQVASCNSNESKYRWRWLPMDEVRRDPDFAHLNIDTLKTRTKGSGKWEKLLVRVPNPDLADVDNTIFQQAEKRGKVKVVRCFGNLTGYFNQPIEEVQTAIGEDDEPEGQTEGQEEQRQRPAPSGKGKKQEAFSEQVLVLREHWEKRCQQLDKAEKGLAESDMFGEIGIKNWNEVRGPEQGDLVYNYIKDVLPKRVKEIIAERPEAGGEASQGSLV